MGATPRRCAVAKKKSWEKGLATAWNKVLKSQQVVKVKPTTWPCVCKECDGEGAVGLGGCWKCDGTGEESRELFRPGRFSKN